MQAINERIDNAKNSLVVSTNDREYDLFVKGMIQAFTEVLTMKFSDDVEDKDEI